MLIALLLTIVIEDVVTRFLTHSGEWEKYNLYCNCITNPIVNLLLLFISTNLQSLEIFSNCTKREQFLFFYLLPLLPLEILVVFTETCFYRFMSGEDQKKCFKISLVTNAISATAGIILYFILN